jgi:hypothetical protein
MDGWSVFGMPKDDDSRDNQSMPQMPCARERIELLTLGLN